MKKWTTDEISNQKGRVAIVTGSSSGIGLEAARVLAAKEATVIIAVRDLEKGNRAAEKILAANKTADVKVMALDLADLASVRQFADAFRQNNARLDLLINNAGVMVPPYSKTADGFELQFGTNHLGHFALTGRLFGLLLATEGSRVVNVSSGAHKIGNLNFDDLAWEQRRYMAWKAYGDSKIANLYFTFELDRRLKENRFGTIAAAAHPGWTATELQRNVGWVEFLNGIFGQNVSMGALPTLRAATDPNLQGGEYFGPDGFMEMGGHPVEVKPNELARDREIAKRLWEASEKLTGLKFDFGSMKQSAGV